MARRFIWCLSILAGMAGCRGDIVLPGDKEPCEPKTFFADYDGDGFGDPDDSIEACVPQCDHDALNALDCDDGDPNVTALAAEVCPSDLGDPEWGYTAMTGLWSEYLAIHGEDKLDQYDAAAACQAWGGDLAVWESGRDYWEFQQAMLSQRSFIGYIGVEPSPNGGWQWVRDSPLIIGSMGWCDGREPDQWDDDDVLSLHKDGYDWCVGRADHAELHYVCERPRQFVEWYTDP